MPIYLKPETQASSLNSSLPLIISFCGSYLIQLSRKYSLLLMPPTIILAQDTAPHLDYSNSAITSFPFSPNRSPKPEPNTILKMQ